MDDCHFSYITNLEKKKRKENPAIPVGHYQTQAKLKGTNISLKPTESICQWSCFLSRVLTRSGLMMHKLKVGDTK
jgi:hypothetical protein